MTLVLNFTGSSIVLLEAFKIIYEINNYFKYYLQQIIIIKIENRIFNSFIFKFLIYKNVILKDIHFTSYKSSQQINIYKIEDIYILCWYKESNKFLFLYIMTLHYKGPICKNGIVYLPNHILQSLLVHGIS